MTYGTYDDDVFAEGESTYTGHLPWAFRDSAKCGNCARVTSGKRGCAEHALGQPKVVIPFPLPQDADLPCVGLWDEYDGETVTAEAWARCDACPAAEWCLQTAVANREEGIWAGTNTEQRRVMGLDARQEQPPLPGTTDQELAA